MLAKARLSIRSGCTGLIFGRNVWQRPYHEALALTNKIREIVRQESGQLVGAGR